METEKFDLYIAREKMGEVMVCVTNPFIIFRCRAEENPKPASDTFAECFGEFKAEAYPYVHLAKLPYTSRITPL